MARLRLTYNIRSLFVRKTTTFATMTGIGAVVFVLASSMMLSEGVRASLSRSGSKDVAIVLSKGADNELSSNYENANVGIISAGPGVALRSNGKPDVLQEVLVVVTVDRADGNGFSNVTMRGVPEDVLDFRRSAKIVAGRAPRAGTDEVMIGQGIRGRFKGVELGQSFEIRKNRHASVVGVFTDAGSSLESEAWGDLDNLRNAFGRGTVISATRVRLKSESAFKPFKAALEGDVRLGVEVRQEIEYYEGLSEGLAIFLGILGGMFVVFFGAGAVIGAAITMYATVANRQREIGTLRAIGFSRGAILMSFVFESVMLAIAGGVVGALLALSMRLVKLSFMNPQTFSEQVFTFEPTPQILIISVSVAVVVGLIGGFLPAIRAARVSVLTALRGAA